MTTTTKQSLPSYDQALDLILSHTPLLGKQLIDLRQARNKVLRQAILADRDQPPFNRSAMDGFAVRSSEITGKKTWPIKGFVKAGASPELFQTPMPTGAVMRIATGAPLPQGADAVIQVEKSTVQGTQVQFDVSHLNTGQNVHPQASDAKANDQVITSGTLLSPHHLGIASAVGMQNIEVTKNPKITILTTGDEVRPASTLTKDLEPQQIRNSNGPMLIALLEAMGISDIIHQHVSDEPDETLEAAKDALETSDLVITVGGVSMGQRDWLPTTWPKLGLKTLVHGVAIQPGKPVFVAHQADEPKLVIGLPGNPVSVWATAHLFAWPVIRKMLGMTEPKLPWTTVHLREPVNAKSKRQVFRAAQIYHDSTAEIVAWHGSGDLMHTAKAQGIVRLPQTDGPITSDIAVLFLPLLGY